MYVTTFQIHIRYTAGRGLLLLEKGNCKDVIVHELQRVYNRSSDDSLNKNYINRSASLYLVVTRTLLQRRSVSLAWRLDREMRRRLILYEAGFTR